MPAGFRGKLVHGLLAAITYAVVFGVGFILLHILWKGFPTISTEFLFGFPERAGAEGGILPAIVGTLWLVMGTMAVALPLGMAAAVYLAEYAVEGRFSGVVRIAIVTLAGIPSIVFGLFGFSLFVVFAGFGQSILAGALTLACMVLPTIIVTSEEALRAVPISFREGSLALGATRWQTIYKSVLPYALPGMFTGSILAVGRAAGETAPILLTAAAFFLPQLPSSVFDQVMALPYHLYILATQHPGAEIEDMKYGTALVLLALVMGANLIGIILRAHFRRKYRW